MDGAKKKVEKELRLDRVAGPFASVPVCSPLGLVPKKDPGEFRLIHNFSAPKGTSINEAIDLCLCSVKYASLEVSLAAIRTIGARGPYGKSGH